MYETTVFFGGTLSGALQGFCSSVMMFGKDTIHAEQLSKAIKEQYRGGFLLSMRAYRMMSFLVYNTISILAMMPATRGRDFKQVMITPSRGEYLLQWFESDFEIRLCVPRSPGKPFSLFVKSSDVVKIRRCADRFGLKECKIETSPDTLLNISEFAALNWNETARAVKVLYSEWLELLRKYQKK